MEIKELNQLQNKIGAITIDDGDKQNSLAVILVSYFNKHSDCPVNDPDSCSGWSSWAIRRTNNFLKQICLTCRTEIEESDE